VSTFDDSFEKAMGAASPSVKTEAPARESTKTKWDRMMGFVAGERVVVAWTAGSFGHYSAHGTVTKVSKSSMRVRLDEIVFSHSGEPCYSIGREIVVPTFESTMYSTNSKWSGFNRAYRLTDPQIAKWLSKHPTPPRSA
jgi:hypothetical protein